jgi:putative transposase
MELVHRRATYRLYPTPAQEAALHAQREAHRCLYNAALEQRRATWKRQRITLSFAEQCRDLTALRQEEDALLPAQAAQHTLKRVERAFQAFFRRIRDGEKPGYPRFKSRRRFKGWSYPTHGDGWRLLPREGLQHGRLRLSGVGHVRIRGNARTAGEPKTCDITYRHNKWYASITLACRPQRACGSASLAFDWGIETFATIATDDGGLSRLRIRTSCGKMKRRSRPHIEPETASTSSRVAGVPPTSVLHVCMAQLPGNARTFTINSRHR